jgi:MFS transporter, DHA1 family, multidrug resistance protein
MCPWLIRGAARPPLAHCRTNAAMFLIFRMENQLYNMGRSEFVALVAVTISLVALAIDSMLPAIGQIASDLGAPDPNDRQLVITMLFLGLAAAQMVYGPLSDSLGRKLPMYVGFGIFLAGSMVSIFAVDFTMMLTGRLLQGIGVAGPRILAVAMVRDQYHGNAMASIMSMAMAIFILVPIIAPSLGQLILLFAPWRAIFVLLLAIAAATLAWHMLRQPETLPPERRLPFSALRIWQAIAETCRNRFALGYTIIAGLIFGAFVGYLTSSQQIFQEIYGVGRLFAVYFAVLAAAIGVASITNSKLVMKYGMRRMCRWALLTGSSLSVVFWFYVVSVDLQPPLFVLMAYLLAAFFAFGVLFGNFNALAMEPLGHIAGVAAAVVGSFTTFISLAIGTIIGRSYDGSVMPLVSGFAGLSALSLLLMGWVERGRKPV